MTKKKSEKQYLVYFDSGEETICQEDIMGIFNSLKDIETYFIEEINEGSMNEDEIKEYVICELGKKIATSYSKIEKIIFTE